MKKLSNIRQRVFIRVRQKMNFGRTSHPFISGDAFRKLADYSIASHEDLDGISDPKVLFVASDFFEQNPEILGGFPDLKILVIGNGDANFTSSKEFNRNLGLVLCQNLLGSLNERWRVLPIGLENRRLGKSGFPRYFKHHTHDRLDTRNIKVLIPPMSPTSPFRRELEDYSSNLSRASVDVFSKYLSTNKYFKLVRRYRFILCLEGNGFDTHRVWEALYLECFPVVLNTPWSQELVKIGLPIMIIDSVADITIEVLLQFQNDHRDFCSLDIPELWMPHWEKIISEALY